MNIPRRLVCSAAAALAVACGGGSKSAPPDSGLPQAPALTRVSQASPFAPGCDTTVTQRPYQDAEVEPHLAVDPADPMHLVGAWQQDRWPGGGAHGLASAVSRDGGRSWSAPVALPFTQCAGGTAQNGNGYPRGTDPWLAIAPDGAVYALGLSYAGNTFAEGSSSAMLVSRSTDGGASWPAPIVVQVDGNQYFNDKGSITADGNDARYVYATWDRLDASGLGQTLFARSIDAGAHWQPSVVVHDPGGINQTIGNLVVVLPDGSLTLIFAELIATGPEAFVSELALRRSTDHGATWQARIKIDDAFPVGTVDPETGHAVRDGSLLFDATVGEDGRIALVWQDARFSGGQRDGIALALSDDGGLTWSEPVQVNGAPQVQAFTPSVSIAQGGKIGVHYFDLRFNTADTGNLPTAGWLAVSGDGQTWNEVRSDGPFDLSLAPDADGYFIGDYHALRALGSDFLLFAVNANAATANRTDVYSARLAPPAATAKVMAVPARAQVTPMLRERVSENVGRQLREEQAPRKAKAARKR